MAGLNHQSFKDDCLSLDSSSEELKTLSNNDNTLRFDLIEMDISDFNKIRASLQEIEVYEKLQTLQFQIDQELLNMEQNYSNHSSKSSLIADLLEQEKAEVDSRSIYVGNVDYSATASELQAHFHNCGIINRVTILCNKFDGHPKGFAYIEFVDENSVNTAMCMNNSLLRGRQIKVNPKRTNKPGISTTNRPVVFRGRAKMNQENAFYGNYRPLSKSRARYFQRETFHPYGKPQ